MFQDQRRKLRSTVAHRGVRDAARPAFPVCKGASGDDALDDLVRALRDERGLAAATLLGLRRSLTPFLAWLAAGGRAWQDTALADVTAYLASRPHWSRVTISRHVQCLRSFFRHAAMRGWVHPGLAEMIGAPRLYTHERLPQGPRWGARSSSSSTLIVATPPRRSAITRCWCCWPSTVSAPPRCADRRSTTFTGSTSAFIRRDQSSGKLRST